MPKIVLGGVILLPLLLLIGILYGDPRHQVARSVPPAPLEIHLKIIDQDGKPVPGLRLTMSGGVARAFSSSVITQEGGGGSISDAEGRVTFKAPLPPNGIMTAVGNHAFEGSLGVDPESGVFTGAYFVKYWMHFQPYVVLNSDEFAPLLRTTKEDPMILRVWKSRGLVEIPFIAKEGMETWWDGPPLVSAAFSDKAIVNLGITGDGDLWPQEQSPYRVSQVEPSDPTAVCSIEIQNRLGWDLLKIRRSPDYRPGAGDLQLVIRGLQGAQVALGDGLYMAEAPKAGWQSEVVIPWNFRPIAHDLGTYAFYLKRTNDTYAALTVRLRDETKWIGRDLASSKTLMSLYYLGGYLNPTGSRNLEYFEAYNKKAYQERRKAILDAELEESYERMAKKLDYYRIFKNPTEREVVEWLKKKGRPVPPPRTFEQIEREDPALAEFIFRRFPQEKRQDILNQRKAAAAEQAPLPPVLPPAKP